MGSLWAVLAFALVLYTPGYVLAYATDLFGFRNKSFVDRSSWAIACSFCVVPIAAYFTGRAAGLRGIRWFLLASAIAAALLLWKTRSAPQCSPRDRRTILLIATAWIVFVLLMLVDAQLGSKLYFSVVMADQSYRIAFTDAVVRTGIPPANPLYFAGTTAPMRYYYFWYVLCAAVVKIAHVSARQSFIASSIWAGFGLLVTVRLYTLHFFRWERRQRWIALGLLLITGADLIPALGNPALQSSLNGDIEWWSVDPIDAWPDSLLWVPHHVASVLCCLLAFLFLWRTLEVTSGKARAWALTFAGCAFASAFGLSVYVAFGFALMMLAWLLRLMIQNHPQRTALWGRTITAAALSAALLAPFLLELLRHPAVDPTTPTAQAFTLSVRRMIDSGLLTGLPIFATLNRTHPMLLDQILRLALLLPGLAMELGLYGVVLVFLLLARFRRKTLPPDEARDTALFFTLCGLLLTMFLSSAVITNNDFGYRAVMLPQFFLLLLTTELLGSWWLPGSPPVIAKTPFRWRLVHSLLALGGLGFLYGAFLLRAWLPIEAPIVHNRFSQLPDDAFQIRTAFDTLNHVAPADAVVAFRPLDPEPDRQDEVMTPNEFYQRMLVMDTGRQMLNAEKKCAVHFGGDPATCSDIQSLTAQLFAAPAPTSAWAQATCRRLGVHYLTLSHRDPNWASTTGWPMSLPMITQQSGFKIFDCQAPPTAP